MCLSAPTPKLTPVPVMQAVKAPADGGATSAADQLKRRMGLASMVLTSATGAAPGATTGTSAGAVGKATLGA